MSHLRRTYATAILAIASLTIAAARQADTRTALRAQIDRIFTEHAYDPPRFGPARWLPDGGAYAIVERTGGPSTGLRAGGSEIARYDAASGARSVLARTTLEVDDYAWSADGKRLLLFTNTKKVWRRNTRGDYWVLDVAAGTQKKMGGPRRSRRSCSRSSRPTATRVAYVRAEQHLRRAIATGGITADDRPRLTRRRLGGRPSTARRTGCTKRSSTSATASAGVPTADGSPTGSSTRPASASFRSSTTRSLYPTIKPIPYPKAGTTNSAVRMGVVAAAGGATTWMKTPGDPRNTYLAQPRVGRIPRRSGIQQLNRLQNQNDLPAGRRGDGTVRRALDTAVKSDGRKTWVDVAGPDQWIDNGTRVPVAQRARRLAARLSGAPDGGDGKAPHQRSTPTSSISSAWTRPKAWLYFLASPDERGGSVTCIARSSTARRTPERVTPAGQPGTHSYDVAPGGRLAFHTYSRVRRAARDGRRRRCPAHRLAAGADRPRRRSGESSRPCWRARWSSDRRHGRRA